MIASRSFIIPFLTALTSTFILSGCGFLSGQLNQLLSQSPASVSGIYVRATNPNGAYRAGQTITIEVLFPSEVVVTGTPALKLATGRSGAEASYVSGSGTDTLLFAYTIQAGDNVLELDYLSTLAISETSGTIKSASEAVLDLTLSTPGAIGSIAHANNIVLDTTPPTITSVTSTTANGAYKAATSVNVVTNFSEAVIVTGTPEIALNSDVSAKAAYQTGSGSAAIHFNYTVGAGHTSLDLDCAATNALTILASSIKDAAGNDAVLTLPSVGGPSSLGGSKAIVIDTDLPSAVSSLDDGFGIVSTTSTPITTWNDATDATTSIATYQIAIGTTSGGTDILDWTNQTLMSTATVTGLTLTAGTTYYTSVRAVDAAGNIGTGTTGDGWRAVNALTIAPTPKMLVTNERFPFTATQGYPGYSYSLASGQGSLAGNLYTTPASAGTSVLRATDQMGSTADANITIRKFGKMASLPSKYADAPMTVAGIQYDSAGNLYVAGTYEGYDRHWLVKKYDGTTWTTLLDEAAGGFGTVNGILVNSSTDIWVIGYKFTTRGFWTVKHYDGTTWTTSDTVTLGGYMAQAYGIAKGPGGEIYVVGSVDDGTATLWVVRKYAAGSWTTMDTYQRDGDSLVSDARAVAVNSLGEVFVGGGAIPGVGGSKDWIVRKYSGGWSNSEIISSGANSTVKALAIDSTDKVYAAGDGTRALGEVRKLTGSTWSSVGSIVYAGSTNVEITRLAIDGTGRPYITLSLNDGTSSSGMIARYSGFVTVWNLVESSPDFFPTAITKHPTDGVTFAGNYNPSGDGALVGGEWRVRETNGMVTSGVTSFQQEIPVPASFTDAAFDSHGNLYVTGYFSRKLNLNEQTWLVKKFDGTTWTDVDEYVPDPANEQSRAYSVYIDENDHVWVAGTDVVGGKERGVVRKFNGTSWSTVDTYVPAGGENAGLSAISGKAGTIFVGGYAENLSGWYDMVIRRFDGTSWSTVYKDKGNESVGYVRDLIVDSNGVAWSSITRLDSAMTEVEAVVVKSTNGTTWTVSDVDTNPTNVYEVELMEGAAGEVYSMYSADLPNGEQVGIIRKWNGTSWSTFDQTPHGLSYINGARDSEGNLYFVGFDNERLMIKKWNGHYLDTVFAPVASAANNWEDLRAIAVGPGGKLIGVGACNVNGRDNEPIAVQLEP